MKRETLKVVCNCSRSVGLSFTQGLIILWNPVSLRSEREREGLEERYLRALETFDFLVFTLLVSSGDGILRRNTGC